MPDCYICLPTCDNCRPKMVTCPACGRPTLIDLERCPLCHEAIPEEARDEAWAAWRAARAAEG
ncbi:MAG: hypothetical protein HFJ74_07065 [Eggerthellaceae bacterium]|nr:hypothetical protein [Eggerthellaceae bacterium]